MATFSWTPDQGARGEYKPRVLAAKFGDGYAQEVGDGINTLARKYSFTFSNLNLATYQAIISFLKSQGGYTAFDFTPPDGVAGRFKCKSWSDTSEYVYAITAEFEEYFGV